METVNGVDVNQDLTSTSPDGPYSWSVENVNLPFGLKAEKVIFRSKSPVYALRLQMGGENELIVQSSNYEDV